MSTQKYHQYVLKTNIVKWWWSQQSREEELKMAASLFTNHRLRIWAGSETTFKSVLELKYLLNVHFFHLIDHLIYWSFDTVAVQSTNETSRILSGGRISDAICSVTFIWAAVSSQGWSCTRGRGVCVCALHETMWPWALVTSANTLHVLLRWSKIKTIQFLIN